MLLTLFIITILTILIFGIVSQGNSETDAAGAKRRHDRALSCADAARDFLMGQFRLNSNTSTTITQLTVNSQVDDQTMATGHYDNLAVTAVSPVSGYSGTTIGISDIANRISRSNLGGQIYRMTVVCANTSSGLDAATRQSEVEFLVRFGI